MEDTNTRGSATATFERKVIQPRLIIQALAFTGILYFCIGQTPPDTTRPLFRPVETRTTFSTPVSHSVLQHVSQQSGLPTTALRIVQARPQTWQDNCLELADSRALCTKMTVPGWQIAVMSGQQRWIYRTNASGSVMKLESAISSPSS
ncbi:hypothetical protein [Allocoleopsis franciscana]|uniref:Uncharacterized protein n=1 Tax=Allocoleopsis franciscana PCC 7113 TaxID=1173027 RepID=K9WAG4_9CYAN|nr:hypothetical protein [Allocoleopsis franciscana]AFZ17218.1 hypothetical protein Mic7113_1333 [Allocoleopsis franciscana PCC 7113]